MADKMLELYTHGQIAQFVLDEASVPEEHYEAFDAHLAACDICGPMLRTNFGTYEHTDTTEECGRDIIHKFVELLKGKPNNVDGITTRGDPDDS